MLQRVLANDDNNADDGVLDSLNKEVLTAG